MQCNLEYIRFFRLNFTRTTACLFCSQHTGLDFLRSERSYFKHFQHVLSEYTVKFLNVFFTSVNYNKRIIKGVINLAVLPNCVGGECLHV